MTNLEHTMLYMCFGAMTGWILCSIGFIIADVIHNVKKKIKAHKEKSSLSQTRKLVMSKGNRWQGNDSLPPVLLEVQYENTRNVHRLRNLQ